MTPALKGLWGKAYVNVWGIQKVCPAALGSVSIAKTLVYLVWINSWTKDSVNSVNFTNWKQNATVTQRKKVLSSDESNLVI